MNTLKSIAFQITERQSQFNQAFAKSLSDGKQPLQDQQNKGDPMVGNIEPIHNNSIPQPEELNK